MSTQPIEVTVPSNNIEVIIKDDLPIEVILPSAFIGQLLVGDIIIQETPTPAPNGFQAVFNVVNSYRPGTLEVFRDQSVLLRNIDYTETTPMSFTLAKAPDSNETLRVNYIKQ